MLVREDNITKSLLDRASTSYNDLVYYTSFNPTVFSSLITQVRRWGNPPASMLMSVDLWDDIIADPDFVNWYDPVSKHELVLEGHIGRLLGVDILTDGFRYPTLQVLQPGEVYMLSAPISLGTKVVRKSLDSRAIDLYNQGRPARGWYMHQIQGQVIVNGRAVASAKRL